MIEDCKKINKELPTPINVLKTYIVQFIYPNGNGWAFINATSVSQAQSVFYNQTKFQDTKITGIKETKWYGNNIQLVFEGSVTTAQLVNVTISLSDIINNSDNYDSIEEYIRSVINLDNYYTKEETDDAIRKAIADMELPEIDLSEYVKKEDLPDAIKEEIDKLDITSGKDGITPHIDEATNHWFIGDEDTGVVAKGQDGTDGTTPHIHPTTKHWMIGNTDTGIVAEGRPGTTGKSAYDIYCEHTTNPMSEAEWIASLGGGDITIQGGNIRKLEDCSYDDGNGHIVTYDTIFESNPTFLTHNNSNLFQNPTNINTESGVRAYINTFESENADALNIARRTREFIQQAIDSTSEDQILVFPKNKTFYVDVDWAKAMSYNFVDRTFDFTNHKYLPEVTAAVSGSSGWSTFHFSCLVVRKKIHINLNGCTIKIVPSWHIHCRIFFVTMGQFYYGWRGTPQDNNHLGTIRSDITNPDGTVIENGILDCNYDNLANFKYSSLGDYNTREYHFHCLDATCSIELKDMIFCNTPGDGMTVSSNYNWNNGSEGKFYTEDEVTHVKTINKGYIKKNGSIGTTNTYTGYVYTDFLSIAERTSYIPDSTIIIRPLYPDQNAYSMVDDSDYWVSEYITVAYYSKTKSFISLEILRFGDALNIPETAFYLRVSAKRDPSRDYELNVAENSKFLYLFMPQIKQSIGTKVINCTAYHCGRDGFTLAQLPYGELSDCYIYNCGQAGIDIENTIYLDHSFKMKNMRVTSILNTTGHNFIVENSRINKLRITNPNVTLINCDVDDLIAVSSTRGKFNHNISEPRRLLRNCVIRNNLYAAYCVLENCVIGGDKVNSASDNSGFKPDDKNIDNVSNNNIRAFPDYSNPQYGNYKNVFNDCVIKTNTLAPSVYNNCIIKPTVCCALVPYPTGTYLQNTYTFNRCKIDVPFIECVDYGWDDGVYKQFGACVDIYDCEIYFTGHASKSTTIAGQEAGVDTTGSNFLGCYVHNLVNSIITFAPYTYDTSNYEFVFYPYQNTRIENNIFIATNSSPISKLKLIQFDLYNINSNDAFKVNIKDNIIKHNLTAPAQGSKNLNLLSVEQRDFVAGGNIDKVTFNIEGNRYAPNKVVKNINTINDITLVTDTATHHYYSPTDYIHTYIYYPKNNKIERDIIYYNLDDSKYYKLEETLCAESITVNGKVLKLPLNERLQSAQIVEVSNSEVPAQAVVQEHDIPNSNTYAVVV